MSTELKFDANQFYQYQEKSGVALDACSIWTGGDYFEFGSTDMNTFRNFLSAFDIFNLIERFPDTKFYGFDIFGQTQDAEIGGIFEKTLSSDERKSYEAYLDHFSHRGNLYQENINYVKDHGLYVDHCHLVPGYFEKTLSKEFKADLKKQSREIGFACLDCNVSCAYKVVFEFIFDLMKPNSYIYMDEYYSDSVVEYFQQFTRELKRQRGMGAEFVSNAAGFGALFYLYPISKNLQPLNLTCSA